MIIQKKKEKKKLKKHRNKDYDILIQAQLYLKNVQRKFKC